MANVISSFEFTGNLIENFHKTVKFSRMKHLHNFIISSRPFLVLARDTVGQATRKRFKFVGLTTVSHTVWHNARRSIMKQSKYDTLLRRKGNMQPGITFDLVHKGSTMTTIKKTALRQITAF